MVDVARLAASEAGAADPTSTAGLRCTSSAASASSRPYLPSAERHSMATFRPFRYPSESSPSERAKAHVGCVARGVVAQEGNPAKRRLALRQRDARHGKQPEADHGKEHDTHHPDRDLTLQRTATAWPRDSEFVGCNHAAPAAEWRREDTEGDAERRGPSPP